MALNIDQKVTSTYRTVLGMGTILVMDHYVMFAFIKWMVDAKGKSWPRLLMGDGVKKSACRWVNLLSQDFCLYLVSRISDVCQYVPLLKSQLFD